MDLFFLLKSSIENFKQMPQRWQVSELSNFSVGFNVAFLDQRIVLLLLGNGIKSFCEQCSLENL